MSTEKDNLQPADGNEESKEVNQSLSNEETTPQSEENPQPENAPEEAQPEEVQPEEKTVVETSPPEKKVSEPVAETKEESVEKEAVEVPQETVSEETTVEETPAAQSEEKEETSEAKTSEKDFDDNADHTDLENKESEEKTEDKIPEKDYSKLNMEQLAQEAKLLLSNYSPMLLGNHFRGIRNAFNALANKKIAELKEEFLAKGGNEIDFHYDLPIKREFNKIYSDYKAQLDAQHKEEEKKQQANLRERLAIIDELKALYTEPSEGNSQMFKKFRELKTRWHNAGRIPRADAENVFRTYYHHLDNFNEFLDFNHELRKMDYEHNLEIRHSIIKRAEELLEEPNVQKALNELQYLHRMWKEEAVPVAEEMREVTWQKFKEITSKIHDRKMELNEQLIKQFEENLQKKEAIVSKIQELTKDFTNETHGLWQKKIKEMNTLRDQFFGVGRVPREVNQATWDKFKEATRNFNHLKNEFYKHLKSEQVENLEKKKKLLEIAIEHKDSSNWDESVRVLKRIQSEWKQIGHVPRKFSDKIWKEFHEANNHFFERYKGKNNKKLEEQTENLKAKETLLEEMEKATIPTEQQELMDWLNGYNVKWSQIGYVPHNKMDINKKYNKLVDSILEKAGLDKRAIDEARWKNKIENVTHNNDESGLNQIKYNLRKQIDEVQKEVSHLQTNLSFFSNADDSNPLFKNAIANIEAKVGELNTLKAKYKDLKHVTFKEKTEEEPQDENESESPTEE